MKKNDRIRGEDNLTIIVGGSKTVLSIMNINNFQGKFLKIFRN